MKTTNYDELKNLDYLQAHQVIKIYPIGRTTLWKYTKLGYLKCKRVHNFTFYSKAELDAFFNPNNNTNNNPNN
jgi:hypothetical protein